MNTYGNVFPIGGQLRCLQELLNQLICGNITKLHRLRIITAIQVWDHHWL